MKHNKCKKLVKLNNTQLIKIIFNNLLKTILKGEMDNIFINKISIGINIITNEPNRFFPRNSKKSFSKRYVKSYSLSSEIKKIIDSLLNISKKELHPNLKSKAKKIIKINNKKEI